MGEQILQQILTGIQSLRTDISELKTDVTNIKEEQQTMRTEIQQVMQAVLENAVKIDLIEADTIIIKEDIRNLLHNQISTNQVIGEHEVAIRTILRNTNFPKPLERALY